MYFRDVLKQYLQACKCLQVHKEQIDAVGEYTPMDKLFDKALKDEMEWTMREIIKRTGYQNELREIMPDGKRDFVDEVHALAEDLVRCAARFTSLIDMKAAVKEIQRMLETCYTVEEVVAFRNKMMDKYPEFFRANDSYIQMR